MQPFRPQVQRAPPLRRCDPPRLRPHVRSRACRRGSAHPRPRCPTRSRGSCRTPCQRRARTRPGRRRPRHCRFAPAPRTGRRDALQGKRPPSQPGRFLAASTTPVLSSASPGEPIPTPAGIPGAEVCLRSRVSERGGDFARDVLGPARVGRGPSRLAENSVVRIDDDGLDLRPAEIDSATRRLRGVDAHRWDDNCV